MFSIYSSNEIYVLEKSGLKITAINIFTVSEIIRVISDLGSVPQSFTR